MSPFDDVIMVQIHWLPHEMPSHQGNQAYVYGLVQDCSNSSALAMELL